MGQKVEEEDPLGTLVIATPTVQCIGTVDQHYEELDLGKKNKRVKNETNIGQQTHMTTHDRHQTPVG